MDRVGDPTVLRLQSIERPVPGPGEVLIRVHAASVNHADLFHRSGKVAIGKEMPHVLGEDAAGTVEAVEDRAGEWSPGDRVLASFPDLGRSLNGGYAEFTCVPGDRLHRLPPEIGFVTAASIGQAFPTAWVALMRNGRLGSTTEFGKRERLVVNAASSGVGTAAVQIGRWRGATVVAVSSGNKAQRLMSLGAHQVVSRSAEDIPDRVRYAFGGKGATLIMDLVGRDSLLMTVDMLERHGRVVCVGTLSGESAAIDAQALISKNATIRGSSGRVNQEEMAGILGLVADGTFHPIIDEIMPLSLAAAAHQRIEERRNFGKLVLVPDVLFESPNGGQQAPDVAEESGTG